MRMTRTWDSTMSMIPKGGDTIWGGLDWSPEEGYKCFAKKAKNNETETVGQNGKGCLDNRKHVHYGRMISFGKDVAEAQPTEIERMDFKPWEEKLKSAHEQGTLVHLSNLDPEYTSGEVEVALLNGITMGGGAGFSIPGTFKVATDKTRLPLIEEQIGKLVTDDPSVVETSLAKYGDIVYPDRASVLHRIETLDKCFSHDTVEEIIDALESEAAKTHDAWCTSTLKKLRHCSPLSLKVSLRSIREGRFQTLDQCLVREYRMSLQGISKQISNDFCEGVRARVVDKDMAPKWNPPNLEQVSKDMVDQYFSPLSKVEPDLELPIKQREAFT